MTNPKPRLSGRRLVKLRQAWAITIEQRAETDHPVVCPKCGHPVVPGQQWDLGHQVAHVYGGDRLDLEPEHSGPCNRADGARIGLDRRRRPRRRLADFLGSSDT